MAVFNQTIAENITQITSLFPITDSFTQGTMGVWVWMMIVFGSYFVMSAFNQRDAFIASSFVAVLTSIFLHLLGMLGGEFVVLSLVLFIISTVIMYVARGGTLQGA